MADKLESSLHDLSDFHLGPEFHNFVQVTAQGDVQGGMLGADMMDAMEADDGTPMGNSGFQTQSEVSGSAFGMTNITNGDSGSSDPSKLLGVSNSSGKRQRDGQTAPGTTTKRGSTMTGRFCGRLPTKEDEKRLVDECKLIGQYLNEDPMKLNTMATIIRGIASGVVRAHLAERAAEQAEMRATVDRLRSQIEMIQEQSNIGPDLVDLTGTIVQLKEELRAARAEIAQLLKRTSSTDPYPPIGVGGAVSAIGSNIGALNVAEALLTEAGGAGQVIMERSLSTPAGTPAAAIDRQKVATLPANAINVNSLPQVIPQIISRVLPGDSSSLHPGVPSGQPVQAPHKSAMQRSASNAKISTLENVANIVNHIMETNSDPQPAKPIEAQVPGAHQFVRAATLHLVAKEEAAFNAHALTAEARKHSEASTKAAELANDLKKTLSTMTDSEIASAKAVEAQKTVKNLESRAQMHASMTSQAVAKAKSMMEIAQNHEREQAIAIATATALQNNAAVTNGGGRGLGISSGMRANGMNRESRGDRAMEGIMSLAGGVVPGHPQTASTFATNMPTMVPTSTVAKPDIASLVSSAQGNIGADGLPNTALNLQNAVPPPSVPFPLLDQSISYMHDMDPSIEATQLKEQIASMHAQQPESLVSAPPIHISDTQLEGVNLAGANPVVPDIPGLAAPDTIPSLQDIPDIPDVDKVPSLEKLESLLSDME